MTKFIRIDSMLVNIDDIEYLCPNKDETKLPFCIKYRDGTSFNISEDLYKQILADLSIYTIKHKPIREDN